MKIRGNRVDIRKGGIADDITVRPGNVAHIIAQRPRRTTRVGKVRLLIEPVIDDQIIADDKAGDRLRMLFANEDAGKLIVIDSIIVVETIHTTMVNLNPLEISIDQIIIYLIVGPMGHKDPIAIAGWMWRRTYRPKPIVIHPIVAHHVVTHIRGIRVINMEAISAHVMNVVAFKERIVAGEVKAIGAAMMDVAIEDLNILPPPKKVMVAIVDIHITKADMLCQTTDRDGG